jgi:hypothetical protein
MKSANIAIPVGLILLISATLKLWYLLAGGSELSSAWLEPLVVLFEFTLGFGLLFARRPAGLWLPTAGTFGVFVGFNLNAIWIGQATCGCFGPVMASPWNALVLDLVVLALLTVWIVLDRDARKLWRALPDTAGFLGGFCLAAATELALVSIGFGSTAAARAALRGDEVFLESPVMNVGSVPVNSASVQMLVVHNSGLRDVRVVGGTSNCACTLIPDLPATIPPGESGRLRIWMNVPAGPGAFQINAVLWTDSPTNETIPVVLRGRGVGP